MWFPIIPCSPDPTTNSETNFLHVSYLFFCLNQSNWLKQSWLVVSELVVGSGEQYKTHATLQFFCREWVCIQLGFLTYIHKTSRQVYYLMVFSLSKHICTALKFLKKSALYLLLGLMFRNLHFVPRTRPIKWFYYIENFFLKVGLTSDIKSASKGIHDFGKFTFSPS